MKTSLPETEAIENHLLRLAEPADALVFEAKLLLDGGLAEKVEWQKAAYASVQSYGRKQLRHEIAAVHDKLFSQPCYKIFAEKIRQIFKKP